MSAPRGDRNANGYGAAHRRRRAREAKRLKREGEVPCARCFQPVYAQWPGSPPAPHAPRCPPSRHRECQGRCWCTWDLGHNDERTGYNGIEHASCNRAAGAVNSNKRPGTVSLTPEQHQVTADYGW